MLKGVIIILLYMSGNLLTLVYQYGVVNNYIHLIIITILLLSLLYVLLKYKKIFTTNEKYILGVLIILGTMHHILKFIDLIDPNDKNCK